MTRTPLSFCLLMWASLLGNGCDGGIDSSAGTGGSNGGASGSSSTGNPGSTSDQDTDGDGVPDSDHCAPIADWDPEWAQFEEDALVLINQARADGADCGSGGTFAPTHPLAMDPALRCAARLHSDYMASDGDDFSHVTRDGSDPFMRMTDSGYDWSAAAENIGVGSLDAGEQVQGWLDSDFHCANLMSPDYVDTGIGYAFGLWDEAFWADGMAPYWTQTFGAPR